MVAQRYVWSNTVNLKKKIILLLNQMRQFVCHYTHEIIITWMGLNISVFDFFLITYLYTAFLESDSLNAHIREQIRSQIRFNDILAFDTLLLRIRSSLYSLWYFSRKNAIRLEEHIVSDVKQKFVVTLTNLPPERIRW